MKNIQKYISIIEANDIPVYLLTLSLFLFKIPPFYIFFIIQNPLLMSQTIARGLILLVFGFFFLSLFTKKNKANALQFNPSQKKLIFFIILLFLLQSISIISADNIISFIRRYKDIVLAFIAFIIFYKYKSGLKFYIYSFIASLFVNTIYQSILLISPSISRIFFSQIIYSEHWSVVHSKLLQNRIHTDTYDSIVIPFLFIFKPDKRKIFGKYISPLSIGVITFFGFISNIRSRMLLVLFEFTTSLFVFKKLVIKKLISVIIITSIALIGSYYISNSFLEVSFVSRILLENKQTDISTLNTRTTQLKNAYEIAIAHPFGVGLGNYYDYTGILSNYKFQDINWNKPDRIGASEYVHNYFGLLAAESGLLSAGILLVVCIFFLKKDSEVLIKDNPEEKALVLAFWGLFIFSMLNPPIPGSFQILFWAIRGLLL